MIYWFVMDAKQTEEVIEFLGNIKATYQKVTYRGNSYDYLSDLLLDLKALITNQCSKILEVNSDSN
jgi:hypothetical protein